MAGQWRQKAEGEFGLQADLSLLLLSCCGGRGDARRSGGGESERLSSVSAWPRSLAWKGRDRWRRLRPPSSAAVKARAKRGLLLLSARLSTFPVQLFIGDGSFFIEFDAWAGLLNCGIE